MSFTDKQLKNIDKCISEYKKYMSQKYPEGAIIVRKRDGEKRRVYGNIGPCVFVSDPHCSDTDSYMWNEYKMEQAGWTVEETPWVPKEGGECFMISISGEVLHLKEILLEGLPGIEAGNCYRTREEAQAAAIRVKAAYKGE